MPLPNWLVWPSSTPTWVTTASTTSNTIVWQSATSTATGSMVINPIYFYSPHPAYDHAMQQLLQQQQAQMAYQNQLNQQQFERHAEAQARRDYAATEAARVIEPSREAAAERSRDLLLRHLNEEQRRTFREHRWFVVEGGRSKRKYRVIDKGDTIANIHALDPGGNVVARLCAHGRSDLQLPLSDHLLTQKIMLELDEDAFLRVANRH